MTASTKRGAGTQGSTATTLSQGSPPRITRLGWGQMYAVLSSNGGTAYMTILLDSGQEWCSCPATVACRHIAAAREERGK